MELLTPIRVGALTLPNRIVMAPMSRARSDSNHAPNDLVAEYYAQRASAGLLITESTSVSRFSVSRAGTSGLYTDAQEDGWRGVAKRVHASGGRVFVQLYHMGRKSNVSRMASGERPIAPSAIRSAPQEGGANTYFEFQTPRAIETNEVADVVAEFQQAAARALKAGLDGVEIHAGNGYLIEQFLKDATNLRTDRYGGGIPNRARFLMEIVDAVADVFGPGRVGVRISPHYRDGGINESDPGALYHHVADSLNERRIAYLHCIESPIPTARQAPIPQVGPLAPMLRQAFRGAFMANADYTCDTANKEIASGAADLVSFGRPYVANPDLVERFRTGADLNRADTSLHYVGGPRGYTDYPTMTESRRCPNEDSR